jgi:hypothetical protein
MDLENLRTDDRYRSVDEQSVEWTTETLFLIERPTAEEYRGCCKLRKFHDNTQLELGLINEQCPDGAPRQGEETNRETVSGLALRGKQRAAPLEQSSERDRFTQV